MYLNCTDPFMDRRAVYLVGKDRHLISGFTATLGEASDVCLHPADPRMIGSHDLCDPQGPSVPAEAGDTSTL